MNKFKRRKKPLSTLDEILKANGVEFIPLKKGEKPKPIIVVDGNGRKKPLTEVTFEEMMGGYFNE